MPISEDFQSEANKDMWELIKPLSIMTVGIWVVIGGIALTGNNETEHKDDVSHLHPENTIVFKLEGDCSGPPIVVRNTDGKELKVTVPENCSVRLPALETPRKNPGLEGP